MRQERRPGRRDGAMNAGARRALLEMARRHAQFGRTYLAIEWYLRLLRDHPGTVGGHEAGQALLDIAQRYEAEGKGYHALSVYDKVAAWLATRREPGGGAGFPVLVAAAHETGRGRGQNRGLMDEIPFVDLTADAHLVRNFKELGRVHKVCAEMLDRAVESLRKLKQ